MASTRIGAAHHRAGRQSAICILQSEILMNPDPASHPLDGRRAAPYDVGTATAGSEVAEVQTESLEIRPNMYYTPDEVASLLRVSRRSVLQLLENGIARGIRIGRQWRVLGNDLLQLTREEQVTGAELSRALLRLSEPSFQRVWDNEEDAVYDNL